MASCSAEGREIQAAVDGLVSEELTRSLEGLDWPPATRAISSSSCSLCVTSQVAIDAFADPCHVGGAVRHPFLGNFGARRRDGLRHWRNCAAIAEVLLRSRSPTRHEPSDASDLRKPVGPGRGRSLREAAIATAGSGRAARGAQNGRTHQGQPPGGMQGGHQPGGHQPGAEVERPGMQPPAEPDQGSAMAPVEGRRPASCARRSCWPKRWKNRSKGPWSARLLTLRAGPGPQRRPAAAIADRPSLLAAVDGPGRLSLGPRPARPPGPPHAGPHAIRPVRSAPGPRPGPTCATCSWPSRRRSKIWSTRWRTYQDTASAVGRRPAARGRAIARITKRFSPIARRRRASA